MSAGSIAQRSWKSFIGGRLPCLPRAAERGRNGYALWHRVWASFIGFNLPARSDTVPTPEVSTVIPRPTPGREPSRDHQRADPLRSGWFALPPLISATALTAAGGDAVILETSSPDGRTGFLVRRGGTFTPEYSLELVLHGVDAAQPVVTAISYTQSDGRERMLLVPVVQGQFGPPASYVRLPGFGVDVAWTASNCSPVTRDTVWDAEAIADSVRLALNEATRDAWRRVGELVDEDLRGVIDGALR